MEKYNYLESVKEDVKNYISDNFDESEIKERIRDDRGKFYQSLYDDMFISDSVTGNASGSYTFNAWQAEENICHNLDLYKDALDEFGGEPDLESAESVDVTIRCYLLAQAISEVLDDFENELDVWAEDEAEEDEEEE